MQLYDRYGLTRPSNMKKIFAFVLISAVLLLSDAQPFARQRQPPPRRRQFQYPRWQPPAPRNGRQPMGSMGNPGRRSNSQNAQRHRPMRPGQRNGQAMNFRPQLFQSEPTNNRRTFSNRNSFDNIYNNNNNINNNNINSNINRNNNNNINNIINSNNINSNNFNNNINTNNNINRNINSNNNNINNNNINSNIINNNINRNTNNNKNHVQSSTVASPANVNKGGRKLTDSGQLNVESQSNIQRSAYPGALAISRNNAAFNNARIQRGRHSRLRQTAPERSQTQTQMNPMWWNSFIRDVNTDSHSRSRNGNGFQVYNQGMDNINLDQRRTMPLTNQRMFSSNGANFIDRRQRNGIRRQSNVLNSFFNNHNSVQRQRWGFPSGQLQSVTIATREFQNARAPIKARQPEITTIISRIPQKSVPGISRTSVDMHPVDMHPVDMRHSQAIAVKRTPVVASPVMKRPSTSSTLHEQHFKDTAHAGTDKVLQRTPIMKNQGTVSTPSNVITLQHVVTPKPKIVKTVTQLPTNPPTLKMNTVPRKPVPMNSMFSGLPFLTNLRAQRKGSSSSFQVMDKSNEKRAQPDVRFMPSLHVSERNKPPVGLLGPFTSNKPDNQYSGNTVFVVNNASKVSKPTKLTINEDTAAKTSKIKATQTKTVFQDVVISEYTPGQSYAEAVDKTTQNSFAATNRQFTDVDKVIVNPMVPDNFEWLVKPVRQRQVEHINTFENKPTDDKIPTNHTTTIRDETKAEPELNNNVIHAPSRKMENPKGAAFPAGRFAAKPAHMSTRKALDASKDFNFFRSWGDLGKNDNTVFRPLGTFGAGMFGYRNAGYEPPIFDSLQDKSRQIHISTATARKTDKMLASTKEPFNNRASIVSQYQAQDQTPQSSSGIFGYRRVGDHPPRDQIKFGKHYQHNEPKPVEKANVNPNLPGIQPDAHIGLSGVVTHALKPNIDTFSKHNYDLTTDEVASTVNLIPKAHTNLHNGLKGNAPNVRSKFQNGLLGSVTGFQAADTLTHPYDLTRETVGSHALLKPEQVAKTDRNPPLSQSGYLLGITGGSSFSPNSRLDVYSSSLQAPMHPSRVEGRAAAIEVQDSSGIMASSGTLEDASLLFGRLPFNSTTSSSNHGTFLVSNTQIDNTYPTTESSTVGLQIAAEPRVSGTKPIVRLTGIIQSQKEISPELKTQQTEIDTIADQLLSLLTIDNTGINSPPVNSQSQPIKLDTALLNTTGPVDSRAAYDAGNLSFDRLGNAPLVNSSQSNFFPLNIDLAHKNFNVPITNTKPEQVPIINSQDQLNEHTLSLLAGQIQDTGNHRTGVPSIGNKKAANNQYISQPNIHFANEQGMVNDQAVIQPITHPHTPIFPHGNVNHVKVQPAFSSIPAHDELNNLQTSIQSGLLSVIHSQKELHNNQHSIQPGLFSVTHVQEELPNSQHSIGPGLLSGSRTQGELPNSQHFIRPGLFSGTLAQGELPNSQHFIRPGLFSGTLAQGDLPNNQHSIRPGLLSGTHAQGELQNNKHSIRPGLLSGIHAQGEVPHNQHSIRPGLLSATHAQTGPNDNQHFIQPETKPINHINGELNNQNLIQPDVFSVTHTHGIPNNAQNLNQPVASYISQTNGDLTHIQNLIHPEISSITQTEGVINDTNNFILADNPPVTNTHGKLNIHYKAIQSDSSSIQTDGVLTNVPNVIQPAISVSSETHGFLYNNPSTSSAQPQETLNNQAFAQTVSALIDSMSAADLAEVMHSMNLSNSIQDNIGSHNAAVSANVLNSPESSGLSNVIQRNGNTGSSGVSNTDSLTGGAIVNANNVENVPVSKIGNIKVNSVQSSVGTGGGHTTGQEHKQHKVITVPYLSGVDFGVAINTELKQQDSVASQVSNPSANGEAVESVPNETFSLLDDLLSGLRQILVPDTTTVKPTTTTKPPTTTPACTPSSPNFKCKGKGMFTTLDTMETWCISMCKTKGCVENVCECGCQKISQVQVNPKKWLNKRKKVPNAKKPNKKKSNKKKPVQQKWKKQQQKMKRKKWQKPKNRNMKNGNRKLLSNHRRKPRWQKPKPTPTTEEPPEIEWEDIVTTTTEMPTTTDDMYWEFGSTISPFEDIKLEQVEETMVRAEKIHVNKIPQVAWASEIKSRLAILAKNALKANEPSRWKEEPFTTTVAPYHTTTWDMYHTTTWDMTTPIPSTAPPTREWTRDWPKPRPAERRPETWDSRPADRWREPPRGSRDPWRDRQSRQSPPPYDTWGSNRARNDPPPTYDPPPSSGHWDQRGWGGDNRSRGKDTWQGGNSEYSGGWDRGNNKLRNSWGRNRNREPTEAPDR